MPDVESRANQGCQGLGSRLQQLSRWGWGSDLQLSWVGIPVLKLTVCHGRCPYLSEPYFPSSASY